MLCLCSGLHFLPLPRATKVLNLLLQSFPKEWEKKREKGKKIRREEPFTKGGYVSVLDIRRTLKRLL